MVTQKGHRYKHNYAYNMLESVELFLLRCTYLCKPELSFAIEPYFCN